MGVFFYLKGQAKNCFRNFFNAFRLITGRQRPYSGGTIMKKIIIALLLLGSIFANSFAQEYDVVEVGEEVSGHTNEVYLSAGSLSGLSFILLVGSLGLIAANKEESVPLCFTAGYNHYFRDEHLGVGGFISYEPTFGMNMLSLQAKITGQYGWERFKIYHSLSAGAMVLGIGDSGPQVIPMFNLTWLGLKFDFDKWNIFIDSSIGSTALLQLGASFKF